MNRVIQSIVALALALAFSCMGAGAALASELEPAEGEAAYFTVYVQEGDDGVPRVFKEYTKAELEALAPEGRPTVSALYWESAGSPKVASSTRYVTLDELVREAGASEYFDELTGVKAVDRVSSPLAVPLKRELDECSKFYPYVCVDAAETLDEDVQPAPAVIAITSASEKVGTVKSGLTSGSAQAYLETVQNRNNGIRFLWGVSEQQLVDRSARGNRLWSNMTGLTLIAHKGEVARIDTIKPVAYTGKPIEPNLAVTGTDGAKLVLGRDYEVEFADNQEIGTATVKVTGKGSYVGSATASFAIASASAQQAAPTKSANPMAVKAKAAKAKAKKLKRKAVKVRALSVSRAVGKVSFKKAGGSKRLSVDKRSGKVKVKKGTKKGLYKMKVLVSASGNATYAPATCTVSVKVRVR